MCRGRDIQDVGFESDAAAALDKACQKEDKGKGFRAQPAQGQGDQWNGPAHKDTGLDDPAGIIAAGDIGPHDIGKNAAGDLKQEIPSDIAAVDTQGIDGKDHVERKDHDAEAGHIFHEDEPAERLVILEIFRHFFQIIQKAQGTFRGFVFFGFPDGVESQRGYGKAQKSDQKGQAVVCGEFKGRKREDPADDQAAGEGGDAGEKLFDSVQTGPLP